MLLSSLRLSFSSRPLARSSKLSNRKDKTVILINIITLFMTATLQTTVFSQDTALSDIPWQMEVSESQYGEPVACFHKRDEQGKRLVTLYSNGLNLDEFALWYEKSGRREMNSPRWLSFASLLISSHLGVLAFAEATQSLKMELSDPVVTNRDLRRGSLVSAAFSALALAPVVVAEASRSKTNKLFAMFEPENDGISLTRNEAITLKYGLIRAEEHGLFTSGLENYCVDQSQDFLD